MRNVNREKEPSLLKANAAQWTKELLAEINKPKNRRDAKTLKKLFGRYKKKCVLDALRKMYGPFCCYCECRVKTAGFQHIEHRMPKDKDKFPERTFDWANLHLVCGRCNTEKGSSWDAKNPILDAVTDVPITNHLSYELYFRLPLTDRGKTTWEHADLDRDPDSGLLYEREKIWKQAMILIERIKKDMGNPQIPVIRNNLRKMCKEEYGSMIQHLMKLF